MSENSTSKLSEVDYRFRVASADGLKFFNGTISRPAGALDIEGGGFTIGEPKYVIESDRYYEQNSGPNGNMSLKIRSRRDKIGAKSFDELREGSKESHYAVIKFRDNGHQYGEHAAASTFYLGKIQATPDLSMGVEIGKLKLDGQKWDIVDDGNKTIGEIIGEHDHSPNADDYHVRFRLNQERVIREISFDGKPVARIHMDNVLGEKKTGFKIIELEILGENISGNKNLNDTLNNWILSQAGIVPESRPKEEIENAQLSAEKHLQEETVWHKKLLTSMSAVIEKFSSMLKSLVSFPSPA